MKKIATIATLLTLLLSQTIFAYNTHLSLIASDGTSLELHKLESKVVLDGFLAFTELKMVFHNPENRQREGRFQIILPDNAAINRFAVEIGGQLQEGEIVETQLAHRAYEDFSHQNQDSALLEMNSSNRFNARIFPIEPNSEKLLILSYSQRLDDRGSEYILPLKGLPELKNLSIKVFYDNKRSNTLQVGKLTGTVSKREILAIEKQNYQPLEDFRMPYHLGTDPLAMQNGPIMIARIVPFTERVKQHFDKLIILIDTSASQAPYLSNTLKRLETLLLQLKIETLLLYTFDQTIEKVGNADNFAAQQVLIHKLKGYNALGASHFDVAIAALKSLKLEKARLLLISDAVITAGETSASALTTQLKTIDWLERVDILIPSFYSDQQVARHIAKAGKSTGMVAPLMLSDTDIIHKLTSSVYADISITVPDSTWYWPEKVETLQNNEPLIVFTETPNHPLSGHSFLNEKPIRINVGEKAFSVMGQSTHPILLKREWMRARIDKLLATEEQAQDKYLKNAIHNEIIKLSVKERVLSPYTSLLILKTEDEYQRYNIARKGLGEILTIGMDGITVIKRPDIEKPLLTLELVKTPSSPVIDEQVDKKERVIPEIAQSLKVPFTKEKKDNSEELPKAELIVIEKSADTPKVIDKVIDEVGTATTEAESIVIEKPVKTIDEVGTRTTESTQMNELSVESPLAFNLDDLDNMSGLKKALYTAAEKKIPAEYVPLTDPGSTHELAEDMLSIDLMAGSETIMTEKLPIANKSDPETLDIMMREKVEKPLWGQQTNHRNSIPLYKVEVQTHQEAYRNFGGKFVEETSTDKQSPKMSEKTETATENEPVIDEGLAERILKVARNVIGLNTEKTAENAYPLVKKNQQVSPWIGDYAKFRSVLDNNNLKAAGQLAQQWRQKDLNDLMALIALGEWYEKMGDTTQAARAYGSLIDYFPARADIRRWASERLLSIKSEIWLSIDSLKKAIQQRPNHLSGHYLLAIAYWEVRQYKKAVETLQEAQQIDFSNYVKSKQILVETLALMLSSLQQQQLLEPLFPGKTFDWENVTQRQLHFVLIWETDANDVDLHIYDNQKHHAFYRKDLPTGGVLYADITTGYGHEYFSISAPKAFPYNIQAHYNNMGPMGYSMGVVHLLDFKPKEGLQSEFRPFVVMKDNIFVELGEVNK
ncbi:VIT domain-containing protein [Candidatus Parabeggiatoa sp. HSG14]|uniref:VIT domain-containing protein n=1 Tax=Candidatus Parabeggiatoa sp. HSG14 TaxID=3055593 RepID=UPI0025A7331A|nr:VIT domain-containing protein [Thiotrichales bacterium HSG14]